MMTIDADATLERANKGVCHLPIATTIETPRILEHCLNPTPLVLCKV